MISGMNHFTIVAEDPKATTDYYIGLLGLEDGYRPDLGFPGAWLYSDGKAILHIIYGRPMPNPRTGVLDHMAFSAKGLKEAQKRFDASGIKYTLNRQVGTRIWQLFSFDPNGARVELDFDPAEEL
jgi:catechol 2,3-dioxygenase-like lactoylglutathione lyase family enzyme